MPLLALLLIPVMERVFRRKPLAIVFGILLGWSAGVQVVGAYAYDLIGWNNKVSYELAFPGHSTHRRLSDEAEILQLIQKEGAKIVGKSTLDIDRPEYRHRLWSWSDSPIVYYLKNFAKARQTKQRSLASWMRDPH